MVMAQIYTIVGEYELAIDELEYVLSIPSWSSAVFLRTDPLFAPLLNIPRFKKVLSDFERQNNL